MTTVLRKYTLFLTASEEGQTVSGRFPVLEGRNQRYEARRVAITQHHHSSLESSLSYAAPPARH